MQLPRRNFPHLAASAAALPAVSPIAWAQTYPMRPVRLIAALTAQSCPILSDAPAPSLCPDCREPIKLVKTIPRLGGLPEIDQAPWEETYAQYRYVLFDHLHQCRHRH
jgi:hypothetical protein